MISRKELISNKEYWLVRFQNSLFEQVEMYLKDNKISKTEFAKELGVTKGYVSQILNGDFDHKLSKLIELSLAIGKVPFLNFENLERCIFLDSIGTHVAEQESKIRINVSVNYTKHIDIKNIGNANVRMMKKGGAYFPKAYSGIQFANQMIGLA